MTGVHRIRLRGPWQYEPLGQSRLSADGRVTQRPTALPPAGVTATPCDFRQTPLGDDYRGRVRYRRRFGRPKRLSADEIVVLVVPPLVAPADIHLNGALLGQVEPHGETSRFDVTEALLDRNELWIELLRWPGQRAIALDLPESDAAVVCLEIG